MKLYQPRNTSEEANSIAMASTLRAVEAQELIDDGFTKSQILDAVRIGVRVMEHPVKILRMMRLEGRKFARLPRPIRGEHA